MNFQRKAFIIKTFGLLGVQMSIVNLSETVECLLEAVLQKKTGFVCVTGVHGIIESQDDSDLRTILNNAFLCVPDGMPTVWMGRLRGHRAISRVYGPDLMLETMRATKNLEVRHFFYGGAPGIAEELRSKLKNLYSGLQIVGCYCPPFRPLNADEFLNLKMQVTACKPDIIWVGLSTPKQERFMADALTQLDTSLMIGVGAAFDFHTGRVRQAPRWIRQTGLEWLYRLIQEPKRLWRRYLNIVPRFLWLVLLSVFKKS